MITIAPFAGLSTDRNIRIVGRLAEQIDRFWLPYWISPASVFESLNAQMDLVMGELVPSFSAQHHFVSEVYEYLRKQPVLDPDDWQRFFSLPKQKLEWFERPSYLLDRETNCNLVHLIVEHFDKLPGGNCGPKYIRKKPPFILRRNVQVLSRLIRQHLDVPGLPNSPVYHYSKMVSLYKVRKLKAA